MTGTLVLAALLLGDDVFTGPGSVRPLSGYEYEKGAKPAAGAYTASVHAGAKLELTVTARPDGGGFTLSRSYSEGGTVYRKTYVNVRVGKDGLYEANWLKVRVPKTPRGGLLVLESNSGVGAIPANQWIQYSSAAGAK